MAIGTSYFGNRILRHVAADMDDLAARGFTGVLHTYSEDDLAHYREQMGRIVQASHAAGLEVQVGPWGLGHVFGGEAESLWVAQHPESCQVLSDGRRVGAGCLRDPAFCAFVDSWSDAAVDSGADHVFWDEPHWAHPGRFGRGDDSVWGCVCERCDAAFHDVHGQAMPRQLTPEVAAFRDAGMVEFLRARVAHVTAQGGRSTICMLPLVEGAMGMADWEPVAAIEGLGTLATDPYWEAFDQPVEAFVSSFSTTVADLAAAHGIGAQIWIQGFRLGPEHLDDIPVAVAAARAAGIEDLWTWGYEACGHITGLGTREPERIWAALCDALTGPSPAAPSDDGAVDAIGALATEGVRPELADLDLRSTHDLVHILANEHVDAAAAVLECAAALAAAVDAAAARYERGGRILYAGAGTAGRLGLLDAVECRPTFGTEDGRVVALLAGGTDQASSRTAEGAEDDHTAGVAAVTDAEVGPDDIVVAISASGRTPWAIGAAEAARSAGALVIAVAGNTGSPLGARADHAIEVATGPEPLAGSTRLKAGTAQKAVLNTFSTAVMVRVGKTYGNLMVDVEVSNEKLADRARRIVAAVAQVDDAAAAAALTAADGEAKTAIAGLARQVGPVDARRMLAEAGGHLRTVLGR